MKSVLFIGATIALTQATQTKKTKLDNNLVLGSSNTLAGK